MFNLRSSVFSFLIIFLFSLFALYKCGVVELNDRDFHSSIRGKNCLVMFYSPTCPHCVRLKSVYNLLPSSKDVVDLGVMISGVDCTENSRICGEYGVRGYPTVKMFLENGDQVEYDGNRQLSDFESFIVENARQPISEVPDVDVALFIQSTDRPVVMGYFRDAQSKLFTRLKSLASIHKKEFLFGYTFSSDVAEQQSQRPDSIVLYRQKHYRCPYETPFLVETVEKQLSTFLQKNRFSLVDIRTPKNEHLFSSPIVVAFIPFSPVMKVSSFRRLRNAMLRLAAKCPDLAFAISLKSDYPSLIEDLSASLEEGLHLVVFEDGHKYIGDQVGSVDDHKGFEAILEKFVEDYKKGDVLERFVKSQPVPRFDAGFVKTVVAKNFEEVVMDREKDVLIEFYAPWCGHCKKLAPIYEQLAETLKDEPSLVIAKIDATANEVPPSFSVEGFPTIYLAAAGKKESPIQFSGSRTLGGMVKWLKKHTTHPIQHSEDIPDEKEEL